MIDLAARRLSGDASTGREDAKFFGVVGKSPRCQPCRATIALIQIGAKGEVQPFETG
jgi:hypothetical protein